MKKIYLAILIIVLFALQASIVFAQSNKLETAKRVGQTDKLVKPIEAYAKQIEDFIKEESSPHVVVADVADYNKSEKAIWKKYDSEAEFEKARKTTESYEIAYIWKQNGNIVATNITYSSPSGDWAQYVYYIFREDGSTAKVNRELRTFLGDIIVNRINIYDENGKLLKETKTFRDLKTQKPVKATNNFQDMDVDIYKKLKDLPFASMLSSKAALSDSEKKFIPKGWRLESKTKGDLNKDSLPDSVFQLIEKEGTERTLMILFKTQNGAFSKKVETKNLLICAGCGGMLGGAATIEIKKGVLLIEQMSGSRQGAIYLHRFRYEAKSKRFRLIGEDVNNFDRLELSSEKTSTNYLTGRQIITTLKGGENDTTETTKRKRVSKKTIYLEDVNYNNF